MDGIGWILRRIHPINPGQQPTGTRVPNRFACLFAWGIGVCLNCGSNKCCIIPASIDRDSIHPIPSIACPSLVVGLARRRDRAAEQPTRASNRATAKQPTRTRGPGQRECPLAPNRQRECPEERRNPSPHDPSGSVGRLALDLDCKRGIDPICPNVQTRSPLPHRWCVPPRRILCAKPRGGLVVRPFSGADPPHR